ncbi:alpha/beta fold hydrolase [Dongia deserti]|uniref:alpha/beta fold hydrolase n=1 Tax=Dongia deserti TaxID=2268030 RepID=UPI000E655ECA|nr:alpha/beta hydrolase [Dongia deserti]
MVKVHRILAAAAVLAAASLASLPASADEVAYKTVQVNGLDIFYREAGPTSAPTVLLLHGFPSSSHMFRNLIPDLATRYHVIAPDYPGFGQSSAPSVDQFDYTFANLANVIEGFTEQLGLTAYVLYMQDYGGPVGIRLAIKHPEKVRGIVVQNAVTSIDGWHPVNTAPLQAYWKERTPETEAPVRDIITAEGTKWQYVTGESRPQLISPDSWTMDQVGLDRPGNDRIQLELLYQYRDNVANYPRWQQFLKELQPPMLITWGKNDPVFTRAGMEKFKELVPDAEVHLLDAGHFALESQEPAIAAAMLAFLDRLPAAN